MRYTIVRAFYYAMSQGRVEDAVAILGELNCPREAQGIILTQWYTDGPDFRTTVSDTLASQLSVY